MRKPIKKQNVVPASEFSETFVQGMYDRMAVSFFKYGKVADAFPSRVDALSTLHLCIEGYRDDGNLEHLIDAANYAMVEFMCPRHPGAHFEPTDSGGSVGRKKDDGVISTRHNLDLK